jgi:hypothetical protein
MDTKESSYYGYRFPAEIISHAIELSGFSKTLNYAALGSGSHTIIHSVSTSEKEWFTLQRLLHMEYLVDTNRGDSMSRTLKANDQLTAGFKGDCGHEN